MPRQLQLRGSPPPGESPDDTAGASMNAIVSFGSSPALDSLRLPDGRKIGDLEHGQLYSALAGLGVVGFSHAKGRQDNIAAYASHLEAIADAAGREAISAWMATKRNS